MQKSDDQKSKRWRRAVSGEKTGRFIYGFYVFLIFFIGGCAKSPVNRPQFQAPYVTGDGWEVSTPAAQHINEQELSAALNDLKKESLGNSVQTLTLVRNGKLVYDGFFHPGPFAFRKGEITSVQSVSKSFTAMAVGIAIDKNILPGTNVPVESLLPQLKGVDWSGGKREITLADMLTMRAGLSGEENTDSLLPAGYARYLFSLPLSDPAGSVFKYRTAVTNALWDVLHTALENQQVSPEKFMDSLLFKPLQIKHYDWRYKNTKGEAELGGGLFIAPRDMIKLGQLILTGGQWHNTQVISPGWIQNATKKQVKFSTRFWGQFDGYGFLFWRRSFYVNGVSYSGIIALGYGGQYVVTIPELKCVVAITSWFPKDKGWDYPLVFIEDKVLPAFR